MAPRRRERDPEAVSRVLVALSVTFLAIGVGATLYAGWRALQGDAARDVVGLLVLGLGSIGFAALLHRYAGDDGSGSWCPACVARNPPGTEVCGVCGARISGHWT